VEKFFSLLLDALSPIIEGTAKAMTLLINAFSPLIQNDVLAGIIFVVVLLWF